MVKATGQLVHFQIFFLSTHRPDDLDISTFIFLKNQIDTTTFPYTCKIKQDVNFCESYPTSSARKPLARQIKITCSASPLDKSPSMPFVSWIFHQYIISANRFGLMMDVYVCMCPYIYLSLFHMDACSNMNLSKLCLYPRYLDLYVLTYSYPSTCLHVHTKQATKCSKAVKRSESRSLS